LDVVASADEAAYAKYLQVRSEVARLKRTPAPLAELAPSRYWADELAHIDYLSDASPLIIRKLRHHAFHITGIGPYDYREHGERQGWSERRLRALISRAGGADLLGGESEALGGFGYHIDGRLLNVDTLKFFEVLVGMRRAGVLTTFEQSEDRRLVWEIGA